MSCSRHQGSTSVLDGAVEQVVGRLVGLDLDRARQLLHLGRAEVGHADVADLALVHQLLQRAPVSSNGVCVVGPVHLVEVDRLDAQVRAGSARRPRAGTPGSSRAVTPPPTRRRPPLVATITSSRWMSSPSASASSASDVAEAVGLGGVEERDALVERRAHGADRLVALDRPPIAAELPGAEADPRDRSGRSCRAVCTSAARWAPCRRSGRRRCAPGGNGLVECAQLLVASARCPPPRRSPPGGWDALVPGIGTTSSPWCEQPGQRELGRRAADLRGDLARSLDQLEVALAVALLEARRAAAEVVVGADRRARRAGELAAAERAVGHDADAELARGGHDLVLEVAR